MFVCMFVCPFTGLSICLSVCLFVFSFICLLRFLLSVCLPVLFILCVCVRACVRVCMCLCMCLSVCICMSHLGLCCRHQNFVYVVCVFQFVFLWLAVAYSHLTSGNATIKHERLALEDNLQNIQIIHIHHC